MKSDLECLACLFKQALNTVKIVTKDKAIQREVLNRVSDEIRRVDLTLSPAEISTTVYRIVSDVTGVEDPYKQIKEQTNREALRMIPELKKIVADSDDSLDAAMRLAVAGNVIDIGIGHEYDLKEDILHILHAPFAINDFKSFKTELQPGRKLLYLGDNSGEIVFDRVFIEELLKKRVNITFVVKSGAIINDALMEDARTTGITDLVPVMETGSNDIGINFKHAGKTFINEFENADLILAKGHGNFETCSGLPYNMYFLLKSKCNVVANELCVNKGDIVFKHQSIMR